MNGSLTSFQGDTHRFVGDDVGSAGGHAKARLGYRSEHRLMIQHLMRVGVCLIGVDATGQDDEGNPILFRVGNHIHAVESTRAYGRDQNTGRAAAVEPTAPGFAAQLAGAVASGLAFVFASRGYGEWPL